MFVSLAAKWHFMVLNNICARETVSQSSEAEEERAAVARLWRSCGRHSGSCDELCCLYEDICDNEAGTFTFIAQERELHDKFKHY